MNAISNSISPRLTQGSLESIVASLATEFAGTAAYHDRTGEFPFANFDCKCRVNTPQMGRMNIPQADATARFRSRRLGAV